MNSRYFSNSQELLSDLVDGSIEVSVDTITMKASGDTQTIAEHIGLSSRAGVKKTVIELREQESDEMYARTIYYTYEDKPTVALFDWIEVHPTCRGNGVGRVLIEETVNHIDSETQAEETYLKLDNPTIQSPLIDVGFAQTDVNGKATWFVR